MGFSWNVCLSIHRGHHRHRVGHGKLAGSANGYRIRLHLHLPLRIQLGPSRLGCHRRIISTENPRSSFVMHHSYELAAQLCDSLFDTVSRGRGTRQPAVQSVFHLGDVLRHRICFRLVHDLRDQRPHS